MLTRFYLPFFCLPLLYVHVARAQSTNSIPRLTILNSDEKTDPYIGVYNFGTISKLDRSLEQDPYEFEEYLRPKGSRWIEGLKKIFVVANYTDQPITIKESYGRKNSLVANRWTKEYDSPFYDDPTTIQPNETLKIIVNIAPSSMFDGKNAVSADLFGDDLKNPLATFTFKGFIDNGISYSSKQLTFNGYRPKAQLLKVRIDRRFIQEAYEDKLTFVPSNRHIKVTMLSANEKATGVNIIGNALKFPQYDFKSLPHDVELTLRVEIAPTTTDLKLASTIHPQLGHARGLLLRGEGIRVGVSGNIVAGPSNPN